MNYRIHQLADYNGNPCDLWAGKEILPTLNDAYRELQRIWDMYKDDPNAKWVLVVEEREA